MLGRTDPECSAAREQTGLEEAPGPPAPAGRPLDGRLLGLSGEFAQETPGHGKKFTGLLRGQILFWHTHFIS